MGSKETWNYAGVEGSRHETMHKRRGSNNTWNTYIKDKKITWVPGYRPGHYKHKKIKSRKSRKGKEIKKRWVETRKENECKNNEEK